MPGACSRQEVVCSLRIAEQFVKWIRPRPGATSPAAHRPTRDHRLTHGCRGDRPNGYPGCGERAILVRAAMSQTGGGVQAI